MWFEDKPENPYAVNKEWNNWFLDLGQGGETPDIPKYFDEEDDEKVELEEQAR